MRSARRFRGVLFQRNLNEKFIFCRQTQRRAYFGTVFLVVSYESGANAVSVHRRLLFLSARARFGFGFPDGSGALSQQRRHRYFNLRLPLFHGVYGRVVYRFAYIRAFVSRRVSVFNAERQG